MFSGIGGAELALPEADWLWCAEIEPFPSAVLAQRFGHPNLGDVLAPDFIDRALAFGPLDLLCGGPPCQAFSIAGNRLSMADPRGNLSLRFVQVAHAIRPRNLLVENVPGWLNTPDNAFGCFLGAIVGGDDAVLPCAMPARGKSNAGWKWRAAGKAWMLREPDEGGLPVYIDDPEEYDPSEIRQVELDARHVPVWPSAGMVAGPIGRAAWRVLDAQYAGLAQRRLRVFVVVDFGDGADPAAVLFERQGLLGNHPPRRETGEGITHDLSPSLTASGRGVERGGDSRGQDPVVAERVVCADIAPTLNAAFGDKQGLEDQHINGGGGCSLPPVSMCLNAGAMGRIDAESETLIPVNRCDFDDAPVPFSIMPMNSGKDYKARETDAAQPIMAGGPVGGNQGGDYIVQPIVPVHQVAGTLKSCGGKSGQPNGAEEADRLIPIAFSSKDNGSDAASDLSPTLRSMGHTDSHANGGGQVAVAFAENTRHELRLEGGDGDRKPGQGIPTIAFALRGRDDGAQPEIEGDGSKVGALRAASGGSSRDYVATQWAVRRLTVTECERLQGYPDNWTLIEFGSRRTVEPDMAEYLRAKGVIVEADNRTGKLKTNAAADGPRYKSLGNAWAVACVRPIAKRIYDLQTIERITG